MEGGDVAGMMARLDAWCLQPTVKPDTADMMRGPTSTPELLMLRSTAEDGRGSTA